MLLGRGVAEGVTVDPEKGVVCGLANLGIWIVEHFDELGDGGPGGCALVKDQLSGGGAEAVVAVRQKRQKWWQTVVAQPYENRRFGITGA
jgi:hypothetical protein